MSLTYKLFSDHVTVISFQKRKIVILSTAQASPTHKGHYSIYEMETVNPYGLLLLNRSRMTICRERHPATNFVFSQSKLYNRAPSLT